MRAGVGELEVREEHWKTHEGEGLEEWSRTQQSELASARSHA